MSKHLRLALAACCCIIVFLLLREPSCSNLSNLKLRKPNKNTKQVSKESVFVFTTYLDKRQNSSFIRIPALNRCPKKSEKFLYVKIESRWVGLIPETIENGCPWTWAKGCSLVAHLHSAQVPDNFQGIDIEIKGPGGVQRMNLKEVLVEKEDGLTVCVPPIYWYTDWTKLILFIEYWRLQGATQFVFYYLSGTEDVRKVFDFYSKEDWMTILSWPLLPSNDMFDPNPMVYRVGHSIAHNDCLLRTKTSRAVLLDVDELIYSKNASFLAMVDTFLNKSSVGGVLFNHHVLQYDPPLNPKLFDTVFVDYLGVLNPKWTLVEGPKKVVFNPSTVKRLGVHAVNQYLSREWKTVTASNEIGMLLHNRYNSAEYVQNSTQTNFSLVSDPEEFRKVLLDRTREIFPDGASFNAGTQEVMAECLQDWRNGQGNCKNPIDGCRFQLQLLEKWNENTDDVYNVL